MKRFWLMFAILMVSGIIAADICVRQLQGNELLMTSELFKAYAHSGVAFRNVFWGIVYERGKLLLAWVLLCMTPLWKKMPAFVMSVLAFCFGFFMMSCVLALQFVGILVAVASVFPHGLLYAGVFGILHRNHSLHAYSKREKIPRRIGTYLFLVLLFITGCVMECVVGIHFIPWVIRLSMV